MFEVVLAWLGNILGGPFIKAALGAYHSTGVGPWFNVVIPLAVAGVVGTFEEIIFRRLFEEAAGFTRIPVLRSVKFPPKD